MGIEHVRLMGLCGSLRAQSTNMALLKASQLAAPAGISVSITTWPQQLPHFSPDLEGTPPTSVQSFRREASEADGLLIACPEYARGIPGAFKNALDWLVGSEHFSAKPVVLFNASPRAEAAQAALRLVLTTMAATIVEEACASFPLLSTTLSPVQITKDAEMGPKIIRSLTLFSNFVRRG